MEHLININDNTYNKPLAKTVYLKNQVPREKIEGIDQIFIINLKRRPQRKARMQAIMDEFNLEFKFIEAIDGKTLDDSTIESLGVQIFPNYLDPIYDRPLKKGEIGCFLSHYLIWEEVSNLNNYMSIEIILFFIFCLFFFLIYLDCGK